MKVTYDLSEKTIKLLKEKFDAYNKGTDKNISLDQFVELMLIDGMTNEVSRKISSSIRTDKARLMSKKRQKTNKTDIEYS